MSQPQAIAPPAEPIEHDKTNLLIECLAAAGWTIGTLADWHDYGIAATANHPNAAEPIRVVMRIDDETRLAEVYIGEREVPFGRAIEYAASVMDARPHAGGESRG